MSAFTIAYPLGSSLYVNVTNRCTNRCTFCIRNTPSGVGDVDLWLTHEPTVKEMLAAITNAGLDKYDELVFCGYGEPMMRFEDCMEICSEVRKISKIPIRINTNGHANRIAGRDVTPEMQGLVDIVSISLNAPDAKSYNDICKCIYGEDGFYEMLDFTKKATRFVPKVIMSVVDVISPDNIEKCKAVAKNCGAILRVRHYSE
ncbi:MAG: TatD family nuclease-associated radical SAM protein [Bacillota bacterium]|nr:TatD family nuclease-associated radical SAM protein [Bacillota bacterium]